MNGDRQFFYHKDEITLALRTRFWLGFVTGGIVTFVTVFFLGVYLGV